MKVLDVCEFYTPRGGGVRTYVHRKLRYAADHGIEQVIVAPGPRAGVERCHGGRIVWVRSPVLPVDRRYHLFANERAVHRVIEREAPDVIEGSSPWAGGWFAGRYPGRAPRVMIFHQDPVAVYPHALLDRVARPDAIDRACAPYWRYLRRLAQHFDATLVSGEWLRERLRAQGIAGVCTVPFGVDKSTFAPARASREARGEWLRRAGAPADAHLLVGISRHHPEKRLGTLIEAVRCLEDNGALAAPVALVLLGDGPLRWWVERRARHARYVHVAGTIQDRTRLAEVLASADALLHGSAAETYGLVVAEALCAGLPLVVPDTGGAADLVDASYAETYPAGEVSACAASIARLLRRPRAALRDAVVEHGAPRVLDAEEHFARLFDFYRDLATTRKAA